MAKYVLFVVLGNFDFSRCTNSFAFSRTTAFLHNGNLLAFHSRARCECSLCGNQLVCAHLQVFGIRYVETQLRVTRADFAVDFLAPWFEPDREFLILPPGKKSTEYTGVNETETVSSGSRVVGLRAGDVANRQPAIYDKRAEVIQTNKMGWLTIWNAALNAKGKPPLNLEDRNENQVWRFELRLESKQLGNRFEMRSWQGVHGTIEDAFTDSLKCIRYYIATADANRAHWPTPTALQNARIRRAVVRATYYACRHLGSIRRRVRRIHRTPY